MDGLGTPVTGVPFVCLLLCDAHHIFCVVHGDLIARNHQAPFALKIRAQSAKM